MLRHAFLEVFDDRIARGVRRRVRRGNVPVEISVAHVVQIVRKTRHDAGVKMAHGVRTAAGEADKLCIFAGVLKYDLMHPAEIGKIRLFTLIDGVIVVRCAVNADGVAASGDLADAPGVILIAVRHEKRRLDAISIQNIQKMLRIGGRPVVKREIDRSRLRRDRIGPVRRRDDHAARDRRCHAVAVRDGIGDTPLAGVKGVYVRGAFDLRGDITVAVIDGRAAGIFVSARLCRIKERIVADERENGRGVRRGCRLRRRDGRSGRRRGRARHGGHCISLVYII